MSEFIGTIRHRLRTVQEHGDGAQSVTHLNPSMFSARSIDSKTNFNKTYEENEVRAFK